MQESREELIVQIERSQLALMRAVHAAATPFWLELDISLAQIKTLFALAQNEPASMGSLAAALGISISDASRLVERLVQVGLADRSDDRADRRRAQIRLTAQGQSLVLRLRQGRRERFTSWLSELTDDELATVAAGLAALSRVATTSEQKRVGGCEPAPGS